jgi:glycosyltransferase involved in cell wall biosynthesis
MTAATVLIPTHEHVEPLRYAVASAQAQTLADFELFIVGDGVTDATRALVAELAATDPRIRFFDFPKGPRKGEIHRHAALAHARGRFVAYLGDDDWWLPDHLATLDALLADADFGHTMQVGIDEGRQIVVMACDLANPAFRDRMLGELVNRFDMTFAGHTLDAYRRLPHGWRTTPPEFPWTDLYMWRQFLAEPWCRARSAMVPTAINTWTHHRPHLSDRERAEDLADWRAQASEPGFRERLWRHAAQSLAVQAIGHEVELVRTMAEYGKLEAHYRTLETHYRTLEAEYQKLEAEYRKLEAGHRKLEAALLRSPYWMLRRWAGQLIRRFSAVKD